MKFQLETNGPAAAAKGHLLIVSCFEDDFKGGATGTRSLACISHNCGHTIFASAREQAFTGKAGKVHLHFADNRTTDATIQEGSVLLVGLGDRAKFSVSTLKDALVAAFRKVKEARFQDVAYDAEGVLALGVDPYQLGRLVGAYAVLIDHNQLTYKTKHSKPEADKKVRNLKVHAPKAVAEPLKKGLIDGRSVGNGVALARDLVTMPAGHLTPFGLMEAAKGVVARSKGLITGQYFWGKRLEQMGAHALLAVSRGSDQLPVLIELDYTPETGPTVETLCLVGKSVTFDSGGLDIKPSEGMRYMKRDMAGGAAVLGAIQAIAALKLPISVKVVMAATENMINGKAYKPGDVLNTMAGITVEVDNTDAEGRLTLADAIEFAKRRGAKRIVDMATLTGAVKMIGGDVGAGCFGNHPEFTAMVVAAGESVGELMINMPMWPDHRKANETEIADLKNSGGSLAGSSTAAWFIREFAGEQVDWVHLDIAGVAYRERTLGPDPKGATGWGVRTAVALAEMLAGK